MPAGACIKIEASRLEEAFTLASLLRETILEEDDQWPSRFADLAGYVLLASADGNCIGDGTLFGAKEGLLKFRLPV